MRKPRGGALRNPKHPDAKRSTDPFPFPRDGLGIDERAACAGILKFNGVGLRGGKPSPFCGRGVTVFSAMRQIPKVATIMLNGIRRA